MSEMAAAESHLRLARAAIAYLKEQVVKYDIQCDWQVAGKFHAAVSQNGINTVLKPTLKTLEALGEPHEWLEGKALHDKLGFDHFAAGIYTPGTVLLNPAALCHGLADSLPENVTLYEQTPVSSIAHQDGVQVRTPCRG